MTKPINRSDRLFRNHRAWQERRLLSWWPTSLRALNCTTPDPAERGRRADSSGDSVPRVSPEAACIGKAGHGKVWSDRAGWFLPGQPEARPDCGCLGPRCGSGGAKWLDAPVLVDGPIISRTPDDLTDFCLAIIHAFEGKSQIPGAPGPEK